MWNGLYMEQKTKYLVFLLLIGLVFLSFEYLETGMTLQPEENSRDIQESGQNAEIRLLRLIDEVEERQEELCHSERQKEQWLINKNSQ